MLHATTKQTKNHWLKVLTAKTKISFILALILNSAVAADINSTAKNSTNNKKVNKELSDKQLTPKQQLGKELFFDKNLSLTRNQACSTCHNPDHAYIDDRETIAEGMASLGADGKSFADRNAPTASYASYVPKFNYNKRLKQYIGGVFWDGRAATVADQAMGPPLNPLEMNMPNAKAVVERIQENPKYVTTFKKIYGDNIFADANNAFSAMGNAIGEYEKTSEFSSFDSKYDKYLRGEYDLTLLEDLGRTLFFSNNNVSCANCHKLLPEDSEHEVFSDFRYKNIGVPANLKLQKINNNIGFVDHGMLNNPMIKDPENREKYDGKIRTSSLRNVAVTAPYMHNGVFKDLRTVILFYDKYNNPDRTLNPETGLPWGNPQVADTIDLDDLKANILTDRKVDALLAFLATLTDERYEHLIPEDIKKLK